MQQGGHRGMLRQGGGQVLLLLLHARGAWRGCWLLLLLHAPQPCLQQLLPPGQLLNAPLGPRL